MFRLPRNISRAKFPNNSGYFVFLRQLVELTNGKVREFGSGFLRHDLNMSTGPRTQSAFIQGNQSTVGQDASQSALFYLFQEVSKLESPARSGFMDTNSPSLWQDPQTVEKEDSYSKFFYPVNSCSPSLIEPAKNVQEESSAINEPLPDRNSPLKVLTLINLQCERLLQPSDPADPGRSSRSYVVESELWRRNSPFTAAFVPGQEADSDSLSFKVTVGHVVNRRQEVAVSVRSVKEVKEVCSYTPRCSGANSKKVCGVKPQTRESTGTVQAEQGEEHAGVSSRPPEIDKTRVMFSGRNEPRRDCVSTKETVQNPPIPKDTPSEAHISNAPCNNQQLTLNVSEDAGAAKPTLVYDHNANLYSGTSPTCYALQPQTVSLQVGSSEACSPIDKSTVSTPECKQTSGLKSMGFQAETNPTPSATLNSVQEQGSVPDPQQCPSWRTKTPRKQPHPSRSADIQDPDFQGVMFRMDPEVDDSGEQCRLVITSKYSAGLTKSVRKPRLRTRSAQKSVTSSSEEECDQAVSKGKVCMSCCTQKTPMWRDAEDGTPLCNACGIRYKKYRVRCVNCWHIPRKEGNSNSRCLKCGNFVRLTSAQPKCTT